MKIDAQCLRFGSEEVVLLTAKDYERLAKRADIWEPPLPAPDEDGNYPLEAIDVVIARGIIRDRRKLGLTQADLARRAGIRVQTLNRIEQGKHAPNMRTMKKIDQALTIAAKENQKAR